MAINKIKPPVLTLLEAICADLYINSTKHFSRRNCRETLEPVIKIAEKLAIVVNLVNKMSDDNERSSKIPSSSLYNTVAEVDLLVPYKRMHLLSGSSSL